MTSWIKALGMLAGTLIMTVGIRRDVVFLMIVGGLLTGFAGMWKHSLKPQTHEGDT